MTKKKKVDEKIVEEVVELIIDLYPKYYRRLNGNKNYKFKTTEARQKQILNFSTCVVESIGSVGEDIIKQYLSFAFGKYAGRKNHKGIENAFPMNWIVSSKLFKDFLQTPGWIKKSNRNNIEKERTKINKKSEVGKVEIKSDIQKRKDWEEKKNLISSISLVEEHEKKRFHNSTKGVAWCIDTTTLINPKSEICLSCKYKESCKQTLKENYPNYFKIRYPNE